MKKKTFLGIDVTPRVALWTEIGYLEWRLKDVNEQLEQARSNISGRGAEKSAESITLGVVRNSLAEAERTIAYKDQEIAQLRARLAGFEPKRGKGGRFTKKKPA